MRRGDVVCRRSKGARRVWRGRRPGVLLALGVLALGVLALGLLLGCQPEGTPPANTNTTVPANAQTLYATYCALCHGEKGEGYKADNANALANPEFLAVASDAFLREGIVQGRPGTSMSAWGKIYGGPLSNDDVASLVALIRSWQSKPSLAVKDAVVKGEPLRGKPLYAVHCASCHGDKGQGGTYMSVANPVFLNTVSDGYLQHAITTGRPGTPMPAYGNKLTAQGVADLVALLRSWETSAKPPPPLPERTYKPLVINDGGPAPSLSSEGRFVAADKVKAAIDEGKALILVDARPASDYLTAHIKGAVSVPFYEAKQHLQRLPKDQWIVSYCACPHAESGVVYDLLKKQGYTQIKVLNEGFHYWRDKGYPLAKGPHPNGTAQP